MNQSSNHHKTGERPQAENILMNLRVLIVAEHASAKFGGEAALPWHYYRILRQRGIPTWLVVHERTRTELQALFPEDKNITYIPDTTWHRLLHRLSSLLPSRLSGFTLGLIMRMMTQLAQRSIVRHIVQEKKINIIHQPIPVSPKEPSMIFGMGVPVIIGPMNGGMDYPPVFQQMQSPIVNFTLALGRKFSSLMNKLIPGKQQAALLIVANKRTRRALPQGVCKQVIELVENGVDLSVWKSCTSTRKAQSSITRYIFVGRLINWKAVDLLLLAFKHVSSQASVTLTIIGDGVERRNLEQQAQELDLLGTEVYQPGKVCFLGWLSQEECSSQLEQSDVLVLPSLLECGGAVVLEAMAKGLPVIATNWGGPADYLDASCGILVEPLSREIFIENLANAMLKLARSPEEREAMGKVGQNKVIQFFDWEVKVDYMIKVYQQVIANHIAESQNRLTDGAGSVIDERNEILATKKSLY
ncbi:glycosyltransferase family 4 protein [Aetokthonos hydrillicola Thurmond2011]|uniref:Glycosyltransferase family 4 protein n=2 Tax=Aetokthonos TaxID=1550243 RepID=A0AAP5I3P1_9CYAN|nr:glycosyltransferase family 4 protein [Aetokthonos hydrillicola]MDR9893199.1 glycosyltransferase family 4 protein [Aetokthonos hydrillicola Thurmond2011]